jgi:hypothetical protein
MSGPRPLPSVAGMHHEPILSDLVRAHERDLRSAADQHRLARSVRPDRPALLGHLRVATLAWLARGSRRIAPETTRGARGTPTTTRGGGRTAHSTITVGGRRAATETTRGARRTASETARGPAPTAAAVRPRCRRAGAAHPVESCC